MMTCQLAIALGGRVDVSFIKGGDPTHFVRPEHV